LSTEGILPVGSPEVNSALAHARFTIQLACCVFWGGKFTRTSSGEERSAFCSWAAVRQRSFVASSASRILSKLIETTPEIARGSTFQLRSILTPPSAAIGSPAANRK